MHLLGDLVDRRAALPADSLCEAALGVFVHNPECRAVAVVDNTGPLAIVTREPFLARMEAPDAVNRALLELADPEPLIAEASLDVAAFVERAARERPAALLGGFIVARDGRYEGVSDLARLLPALAASASASPLIERLCAEVREPTRHALAAAEGLLRMRLPEGSAAHLETIVEAAQSTLALLEVVTDLQRAKAGRLEIAAAPRRLQALMDDLEARWRGKAEIAGVTLLVSYDGAPECVAMIDAARLMQVFDAVVGHAMAHAARGVVEASLQVRASDRGYQLTGRVRDNCATYSADDLAGLFRGDGDASEAGGMGLRLELRLAERAIAAMSGVLDAKPNPGPGATISFELEVETAEGEAASEAGAPATTARSAHILVVDDNATNRMVVEALCEMFDCSTESVADGLEAVEAAKGGRFDVILMDIKMPRMDGVTAAKEIRKLPAPAGRVPIVALTANADADEVAEYLAAGMRSVVEKPIKPERLMEALDEALTGDPAKAAAA